MNSWLSVLSDLFVNLAAGWFALILIELQISKFDSATFLSLTGRFVVAILTLLIAKIFREKTK